MRKNFGAKPMCYPMPVYIIGTYNEDGSPNAMNAAWGGITEEAEITICVDADHKHRPNNPSSSSRTAVQLTKDKQLQLRYITTKL